MERLETAIESDFGEKICDWAIENKFNVAYVKFTGAKGWPDRILTWGVSEDGPAHTVWIEWKRPGEEPRRLQKYIHKTLRDMGHDVRVFDDYRVALEIFKEEIRTTFRAGQGNEADCLGGRCPSISTTGQGKDLSGVEVVCGTEKPGHGGRAGRARTSKGSDD